MLLKLIPRPTEPTIHFSITLPTFPSHLDPPQSYTAQVNHLLVEELEIPDTLHSLDKSVGFMSLLDEVVFEIKDDTGDGGRRGGDHDGKAVRVTCQFVDGALEEWVTEGTDLISALESIIHNVQESTLEDDKERQRERYRQSQLQNNRSRALNRLTMPPASALSPMTVTKPRHKKQRSLFMQIVSSIANLTSTSTSSSSHLPTFVDPSDPEPFYSPPPSPTAISSTPIPPSSNHARLLRRTARSNLVNTYRRHVLPELTRRFPKEGGFCVWILHSMRRRAWERMEDLIQEGARLQQQVLELQRHEHEEREQEQRTQYQQERAKSPIPTDEQPFGLRFSLEETGFSATTMTAPLSFSDEGGSTENENEATNVSRNYCEDDLETITDGSSVHTPSSTSHIGPGFMGGSSPTTTQPPPVPPKISPSNSQPYLPSHFLLEYNALSRLRERLHSLILFADSQIRISEDDKRNRDEILLVRGRRKAWLNGELVRGIGSATSASNGMEQMQWGFAAPFKSSPLARYSWGASTELDEASNASADYASVCPQQQQIDEEDEDEYDEFHGPPAIRNHTLGYTHGRQSRRSRYFNGAGKLLPVAEESECENFTLDGNPDTNGSVKLPGDHSGNSFHHRDDSSLLHFDEDTDSSSDGFSLEDPRELDLELGFGLHEPTSFIGEDGEELLGDVSRRHSSEQQQEENGQRERRSGETSRIAFEMERPKIIPRVRDGLGDTDDDSVCSSSSSSISTRSGVGLLSWGYWRVGRNSGGNSDGGADGAVRRCRSWKNGIGIGLGGRGRSLNKTWQRELEEEELSRRRVSTSSTASSTSSSSTKSQKQQQQQQNQYQREPAQVELEPELHRNQDNSSAPPLLCQPVSFSVSHIGPAQVAVTPTTSTPTSSPPATVAILPLTANTPTSPKDTTQNPKDTTRTPSVLANSTKTSFVPTAPLSFTTKKLCMASPAPNVYADIDVSVVHVGEDEKSLNRGFGASQSVNPGAVSHTPGMQEQCEPGHAPRLRSRRHKREYQYQYPRQRQHPRVYRNDVFSGQGESGEFELSGYGQFSGGSAADSTHLLYPNSNHQHQQRHNSMIHARLHLDELLLEEGLFNNNGCLDVTDQEEFTLAMDVPLAGSGGRVGKNLKALKKKQYLQLHQNRDSANQQLSRLRGQQQQQVRSSLPSSSQVTMNGLGEERRESLGSVAC